MWSTPSSIVLRLIAASLALCCGGALHAQPAAALRAINSLDVPRYMGTWYEIAKYPNQFQKQCIANTLAEYRLLSTGDLQVINRCKTSDGQDLVAIGEARQLGSATSPKLQVRFAPSWLSMFPFVWGNYWVIDLDSSYQLAAVSEPERDYLWILSRSPKVSAEVYNALLLRLKSQGFDLNRLERSNHVP